MIRPILISALLAASVMPARAQAPADQLLALVSQELPAYVPDVDAATLSRHQLATIYSILHSSDSGGKKIALIRSTIGGRLSLRSLLFR